MKKVTTKSLRSEKEFPNGKNYFNEIHKIFNEDINNDNYRANRILIALRRKDIKKGDKP